ncbi:helix-turn-helix domain-containing protein [Brevibacillus brevis]|uniref:helix-turn-helix domain-containing protein n=1 Tax=Brevibacillus brevis TaxID=1393 RepID=UPI00165D809D|nr:helix-turn-helix transcriptional regulator [Brevibacillus brevis]
MKTFGQRLRFLRNKKDLSQKELATKFQISESAVGMYERNQREPSFELLQSFATFFDVSVDYIVGRVDDPKAVLSENVRLFVDSLELTDREILDKINLINVDGRPLSREEAIDFITFVRTKRAMEKQ